MIAIAVPPIANPIRKRRNIAFGIVWCSSEAGCSRSVPKAKADTMNKPRHTASIRYSGQWRLIVSTMDDARSSKQSSTCEIVEERLNNFTGLIQSYDVFDAGASTGKEFQIVFHGKTSCNQTSHGVRPTL